MMARQSFLIAGETFASKKALIGRTRSILHGYPENVALHAGDQAFTRNFWLLRTDGTSTDFSFLECLSPSTPMQRFHRACRAAIAPDIMAFKARFFEQHPKYVCPYTGEPLSLRHSHLDHAIPFASLVAQFVAVRQIEVAAVPISGRVEDGTCLDRFVDRDLEQTWRAFHQSEARYRVVSPTANLGVLRRRS